MAYSETTKKSAPEKKRAARKILLVIIGSFLLVGTAGILALPFVFPVDQFRPQIEKSINHQIQGKVTIGRLSLKSFPSLGIVAHNVTAFSKAPFDKEPLMSVEEVIVSAPLYSFLVSPQINVKAIKPQIAIVSSKTTSNITEFAPKPAPTTASQPSTVSNTSIDSNLSTLPSWLRTRVLAAKINITLSQAYVKTENLDSSITQKTEVRKLDLELRDIGLNSPIALKSRVELEIKNNELKISGPVESTGTFTVRAQGQKNLVRVKLENNLKDLHVSMGTLFQKLPGTELQFSAEGDILQGENIEANLSSLMLHLGQIALKGSANVSTTFGNHPGSVNVNMAVSQMDLEHLASIVPMVQSYKLDGNIDMKLLLSGTPDVPQMNFSLNLTKVSGSTPQFKHSIKNLNGKIQVEGRIDNPQVTINPLSLQVASSDLSVNLKVAEIKAPKVNLILSSTHLNFDELMGTEVQKTVPSQSSEKTAAVETLNTVALDESLDEMAPELEEQLKNPLLNSVQAKLQLKLKSLQMNGAKYKDVAVIVDYGNRKLNFQNASMQAYRGEMILNGNFELDPKAPTFNLAAKAKAINVADAVAIHAPLWKNEISGILFGDFNLAGRGIRKAQLHQNLSGKLNGQLKDGKTSIPIVKLLAGVIEKLPAGLSNKMKIPSDKKFNGDFKTCILNTTIKGRELRLENLDLNYDAVSIGIGDMQFKAAGVINFDRIVDLSGIVFLDKKSLPIAGIEGPSGKAEIPLRFKGNMSDPKIDYEHTLKILVPRLAKGELKKHESKIKETVAKELKKKAPKELQKTIDDLKNKFKFNF